MDERRLDATANPFDGFLGRGQTAPFQRAAQFGSRFVEIVVAEGDESARSGSRVPDGSIVVEPKPEGRCAGNAAAHPQRFRHGQRVAHANQNLHLWQQSPPKRQGKRVARIFPAPRLATGEAMQELSRPDAERMQARLVRPIDGIQARRAIPSSAVRFQERIVEAKKGTTFPKAFGIVRRGPEHVVLWTEIESTTAQETGDH